MLARVTGQVELIGGEGGGDENGDVEFDEFDDEGGEAAVASGGATVRQCVWWTHTTHTKREASCARGPALGPAQQHFVTLSHFAHMAELHMDWESALVEWRGGQRLGRRPARASPAEQQWPQTQKAGQV